MSKLYVVNCVKHNGTVYNKDQEIDFKLDDETRKSWLDMGVVTKTAPESVTKDEVSEVVEPVKVDPVVDVFENPFLDIDLEEKHAKVLIKAEILNMDDLSKVDEKTLADLHGISKTLAKQIVACFK